MGKGTAAWTAVVLAGMLAGCATTAEQNKGLIDQAERSLVVEPAAREGRVPLVLAHYMPWFQAPKTSKSYGWHWHMGFYDPYETGKDGKAPIATHYYPLTGPYDSADPAVIEYQLTLMKLSGIDGVIVDWYGIEDALDYKKVHESTQVLFQAIKAAGMKFAVCYEDQSMGKMVQAKKFDAADALKHGQAVLKWLDDQWFNDPAYVKIDGRPLLLDFGPQFFLKADQWESMFAPLKARPYFVALNDHMEFFADNIYPWPPMYLSNGGDLPLTRVVDYFNDFYSKTASKPHLVTTVFRGFHDIYQEAQVASSYGYLDDLGGGTFQVLLDAALKARADVIQVATWNDYGEGTVIEPNEVRGYQQLEQLQTAARTLHPDFPYTAADLRVPLQVWKLRQAKTAADAADRWVQAVFHGDAAAARNAAAALPAPH